MTDEAKARAFDWCLPMVTGNNPLLAESRALTLTMGLLHGFEGEALVEWAVQQQDREITPQ